MKKCENCQKNCKQYGSRKPKFCSRDCANKFNGHKLSQTYQGINNPHYKHGRYIGYTFCLDCHKKLEFKESKRCHACYLSWFISEEQLVKRIKKGSEHPCWKHGKSKNYKTITTNNKLRILEHRFVMEQHLGRKLSSDEIVHHINNNRFDNRIKNLQVMTLSEHTKLHHKLRALAKK